MTTAGDKIIQYLSKHRTHGRASTDPVRNPAPLVHPSLRAPCSTAKNVCRETQHGEFRWEDAGLVLALRNRPPWTRGQHHDGVASPI